MKSEQDGAAEGGASAGSPDGEVLLGEPRKARRGARQAVWEEREANRPAAVKLAGIFMFLLLVLLAWGVFA